MCSSGSSHFLFPLMTLLLISTPRESGGESMKPNYSKLQRSSEKDFVNHSCGYRCVESVLTGRQEGGALKTREGAPGLCLAAEAAQPWPGRPGWPQRSLSRKALLAFSSGRRHIIASTCTLSLSLSLFLLCFQRSWLYFFWFRLSFFVYLCPL